jgi:hypothetical protein
MSRMGGSTGPVVTVAPFAKRATAALAAIVFTLLLGNEVALAKGILFAGTDNEDFAFNPVLPDRLGRFTTDGATVTGGGIIDVDFFINGMGSGGTFLFTGHPNSKKLLRTDLNGNLLGEVPAGNRTASGCCYEDMIYDGKYLYHAHYSDRIDKIDPITGNLVESYPQTDVVGLTFGPDGSIWISKWSGRQVGIWDPGTNEFTEKFTTGTNAGGLAYDSLNRILWVGVQRGWVTAYDLSGESPVQIEGSAFQPFGPINETIDGLEFIADDGDGDLVPDDVDDCPTFANDSRCNFSGSMTTSGDSPFLLDLVFTNNTGQDITSVAPSCNNSTINIVVKKSTGEVVSTVHPHGPAVILAPLGHPQTDAVKTPDGGVLRVKCDARRRIPAALHSQLVGGFLIEATYGSFFQAPPEIVTLDNVFIKANPITVTVHDVTIDIKPGASPNSINLGSSSVPVAILSSAAFDARTVDPFTVTLAGARVRLKGKAQTPMASFEDINGDGRLDLVVHVSTEALQVTETSTTAIVDGLTFPNAGVRNSFRGSDSIRIVP